MGNQTDDADDIMDPQDIFVTLELDDDSELECKVIAIFEANDQDYIALLPVENEDDESEEDELLFYRYSEDEEGNPTLDNIENEAEFEIVADRFDELLDEEDFDAM